MRSVNLGRWSRRVERYFNMKGGGGLVDVEPGVRVVLGIASGVEDRYLEGWFTYGFATNVVGVAAQITAFRIRNPPASNVVAVIEQFRYGPSAADNPLLQHAQTAIDLGTTATLTSTRLDPRGNPAPTSVISVDANAGAKQLNTFMTGDTPALTTVEFVATVNQEIPILPGDAIQISANTVNVTGFFGIRWRERSLEQSELT